ncbi:peptidase inhibitor family I36 protein [Bacillus toyonensis]|uniref:peptidase inhibitor family I36 protein n=1 Tax=Bacillus toyonensis TaxID=155322 RepID=UPI001CD2AB1C|nr:peptidase inhibitor family I36 protein [Bacillus toyonensis]MCA1048134.1 peptidase inhibitor family I36 protein [Bacillus toyonensis]
MYHYNSYEYNDDVRQPVNRFYEHINGGGMSFTLNSGERLSYVGDPWNDRISSVSVAPRTLVILYTDINYGHPVKILENFGNTSYLFNIHQDFNDVTSSIKTFRIW